MRRYKSDHIEQLVSTIEKHTKPYNKGSYPSTLTSGSPIVMISSGNFGHRRANNPSISREIRQKCSAVDHIPPSRPMNVTMTRQKRDAAL